MLLQIYIRHIKFSSTFHCPYFLGEVRGSCFFSSTELILLYVSPYFSREGNCFFIFFLPGSGILLWVGWVGKVIQCGDWRGFAFATCAAMEVRRCCGSVGAPWVGSGKLLAGRDRSRDCLEHAHQLTPPRRKKSQIPGQITRHAQNQPRESTLALRIAVLFLCIRNFWLRHNLTRDLVFLIEFP